MSEETRTITLVHEVVTQKTIRVPLSEIRELTARWHDGDREYAVQRFADVPEETAKDRIELFSSIWYSRATDTEDQG